MSEISRLIIEQGRQAAEARAAGGAIWGRAVENIAQIPERHRLRQRQEMEDAMRLRLQGQQAELQAGELASQRRALDVDAILGAIPRDAQGNYKVDELTALAAKKDPGLVSHVQQLAQLHNSRTLAYQEQQETADLRRRNHLGDVALALLDRPDDLGGFQLAVASLTEKGVLPRDQANQLLVRSVEDPGFIAQQAHAWVRQSPEARAAIEPKLVAIPEGGLYDVRRGTVAVPGAGKAPTSAVLDAAAQALFSKQAAGQSLTPEEQANLAGYEARKAGDDTITIKTVENGKMVEKVMKKADALKQGVFPSQPPASIQINTAQRGDVEDQAQQLLDGNLPPSFLSKRSSSYNAIVTEANRLSKAQTGHPINLGKSQLDYAAASRWVAGMNAPQMIRFKGLAVAVINTINEVKRLGEELQQGGIQKWNSVTRSTVQQLYGNTPQSRIANDYMVAVGTLKEEFANLASGGYAPTDPAWRLANTQINANYGFKDLQSTLTELQRLINYRIHAFDEVAPTLVGGTAQPAQGGPAGTVKMRAPDGGALTVPTAEVQKYQALGATVIR